MDLKHKLRNKWSQYQAGPRELRSQKYNTYLCFLYNGQHAYMGMGMSWVV